MDNDRDDIRWLTYAELGQIRGISTASATRLAFRHKWRRQGDNSNTVRVAVPSEHASLQNDKHPDDKDDIRGDDRGDIIRLVTALETAVSRLSGELAAGNARFEVERARADAEREARTRAEVETGALRVLLAQTRAEVEEAVLAVGKVRQADVARRARGVLGRLMATLRRE